MSHLERLLPALLMPCSTLAFATTVRRRCQSQAACDFAPVVKEPPAKQFLDQHLGAAYADPAEPGEKRDGWLRAGLHCLVLLGFNCLDLRYDQRQSRDFTLDLGT